MSPLASAMLGDQQRVPPLASMVMANPVGTERIDQSLTNPTPGFQPAVDWGGYTVSRPMYDTAHAAINNAMGWMAPISPRVFHGTAQPGMAFDAGRPAFFTTDPARASFYAETGASKFVGDPAQPNVIPAYLDMKNPKVIENLEPSEHPSAFKAAQDAGHDGVILRANGVPDTYVSFNPSQVLPGIGSPPAEAVKYGLAGAMLGAPAAAPFMPSQAPQQ